MNSQRSKRNNEQQEQKRFQDILHDFDNAMLTTLDKAGRPRSRPMRVAEVSDDNSVWFVTDQSSGKVEEIQHNAVVAVTMQGGGKYLSLTGTSQIVQDRSKIEAMWKNAWKIWFPGGKEDPSLSLLKVVPEEGEYWDMSGTKRLKFIYEAGKAYFSGEEIDLYDDEMNAKVQL